MTLVRYDEERDVLVVQNYHDGVGRMVDTRFTFNSHRRDTCIGEFCCLHGPSDHPLRDAQLNWRTDRGIMERICEHGIGHDDPDDMAARELFGHEADGVHGCDGCCWGGSY